ncbi:Vacuolar protein sorting-associated protein 9a [Thalictrum thalictroides]|uniref:Vacuolar protein sorting-associated protein 9a n=1 Tax=Thalictrum thalictroides TaxID=46969 RepID=A0A7J6W022_THATH|nr:Vacuolar protein sorting-associated protein 9a [Thalictrum thalictroides]
MDETEFEENMDAARTLLSGLATNPEGEGTPSDIENDGYGYVSRTESTKTKPQLTDKNKQNSVPFLKGHLPQASLKKSEEEPDINHQASITNNPSSSDLEKKGATEILKEEEISRAFHGYHYLYAQAGDLTVNDVEDLLNNYKQLVFKYVCLSKGMSVTPPLLPLPISQIQTPKDVRTWKESEDGMMVDTIINNADAESKDFSPDKDSVQGTENSESKVAVDESVTPQGEEKDEILQ